MIHESDNEEGRSVHHWWKPEVDEDEYVRLLRIDNSNNNTKKTSFLSKKKIRVVKELERLALLASEERLNEIRHKLHSYSAGDFWVPTGGLKKEEMEIPDVNTILLLGFHNAGKTSLVSLMHRVLSRSGLLHFSPSPSVTASRSLFMEEHNVLRSPRSGFCVYDARGFDYDQVDEALEEVKDWMTNGVCHKKLCLLQGENTVLEPDESEAASFPVSGSLFATRDVNYVMVVANAYEIYTSLNLGDNKPLEALKQLFHLPTLRKSNESPLLILTHGDKLSMEARIESRVKICEFLGVSESSGAYDVVCVADYYYGILGDEYDPISAYAVSEAVYRGIVISDKGLVPKKRFMDWVYVVFVWLMSCLAAMFGFLAHICDHFVPNDKLKWTKKQL